MPFTLSLIGFGEAGSTFAHAAGWEHAARAFDIVDKSASYEDAGVDACLSIADVCRDAARIISVVTADQALSVAEDAAQHIAPDCLYFDMNSVAPDTKRVAAKVIDDAGGRYVDVAVMAPVNPARLAVPLLLSGRHAEAGRDALTDMGFTNIRIVGTDVGRASSIKMIRSIMVKGQEALTAEMMLAAHQAGVVDEVLGSLGKDWIEKADYNLDRMMVHGLRRSAEMREVVKTLDGLNIRPLMTNGTVARQWAIGVMGIGAVDGIPAKLETLTGNKSKDAA
jgi:3-hydroxyisobutyrate dehydrogenase-like beta-hydroxyacid dehydrogenase